MYGKRKMDLRAQFLEFEERENHPGETKKALKEVAGLLMA